MVDIYLDEGVSNALAQILDADGHDVLTPRQLRSKGQSDAKQLLTSTRLGRILITHNGTDFLLLQIAWRQWGHDWGVSPAAHHGGILVVPQPPRLATPDAAPVLNDILHSSQRLENGLFTWKPRVGWRQLG